MQSLSPRNRRILLAIVALLLILVVICAGIVLGRTLAERNASTSAVIVPVTPAAAVQITATLAAQPQATSTQRIAVPDGNVETETGIAILPIVTLQGNRRYVLQVTSRAGALSFQGSYSLGSIDPKIAINPMTEIKGTTPWEQEILPPAPDTRQWTLGASLSTTPIGQNIQVQVWDIGPK
jgi:hypothetical protein